MIAHRLRPIGWVAGVATATLGFYLVSLQVATERAALERVERRIAVARRDIRRLETEFAARASLRQLEQYNGEVLALAAPRAQQYLTSDVQLVAFDPRSLDGALPPPGQVALARAESAAPAPAPADAAPARPSFKPAIVEDAARDDAPVVPAARRVAPLQAVAYAAPARGAAGRATPARIPTVEKVAMLDDSTLGELARRAAKEAKAKR
ncbi:hypothetical protein GVO57_00595 [Sphingomonas changnyeongensis]|uniref:Uncharacterized protein n=1 Tax=Sphingomonas changnyeongensis TaxID=2698679 RepID=A0A7Z2S6S7_9SPHN|nr:hypothetical protein [Sphingomonas changnyeongensis]QHL89596.1 hypothetical protein GVO57_00595 [Sphingomonas changnyeongensis]